MTNPKHNPSPVVTRADREAALAIIGASGSVQVQASEHWVEHGTDLFKTMSPYRAGLKAVALAIATAREAGKLEERAAVVAELRKRIGHCGIAGLGYGLAADLIEAGEHEKNP